MDVLRIINNKIRDKLTRVTLKFNLWEKQVISKGYEAFRDAMEVKQNILIIQTRKTWMTRLLVVTYYVYCSY